jgi:energy-coupling factor transporter ATP-binding protein EcfA2
VDPEPGFDVPPKAIGVRVGRYKNLSEQWVPWSDGMALFGANGSGKTNFLEALAILLGTDQTLMLNQQRLGRVQPGALEFVCEVAAEELPWSPSAVLDLDLGKYTDQFLKKLPVLSRALADSQWWTRIGVDRGDSFIDGLKAMSLTDDMLDYLMTQVERPVIRYTLESFSCKFELDDEGQVEADVRRLFRRTLMGAAPPVEMVGRADALPDVFGPLRSALGSQKQGPDGFIDLLALSDVTSAPALLEWLPRSRSSSEANDRLLAHYRAAVEPATEFAQKLSALPVVIGEFDPDPIWWLHLVAAKAAGNELDLTLPYVRVDPLADGEADLDFIDSRSAKFPLGRTGDFDVLEHFSAGERRWVDEALATAARELEHFATTAKWQANLLDEVDEAELIWALDEVSAPVQQLLDKDSWWSGEAMAMVQQALEGPLLSTARRLLAEKADPLARGLLEASIAGLASLRPHLTVRVIDEPEAHLHPTAQRRISLALDRLRLRGANVILASHSPYFLDLPGWQLLHVQRTPEGTTVSALTDSDLDVRKSLAGQMGWTHGELLTRMSLLLIVEGEHDRLVLETLYGQRLREAGVTIIRMHGTPNLLATAEMDFIERLFDVPVGVLLDFVRLERVDGNTPTESLTQEEKALRYFRRACHRRKREVSDFGLKRPDIVAYLNEDAIRVQWPDFVGWGAVLRRFHAKSTRPSFKPWLKEHFKVDLTRTDHIREVVQSMVDNDLPAVGELAKVVSQIELTASEGRWPSGGSRG